MEVSPVKKYRTPKYPDRQEVLQNPEILKSLPERWRGNACVGAALSTLFIFTLTSCARASGAGSKSEAKVAPIFDHGGGRGSFGCVSVAPPSFLSEEEAFQVIQEEAKKYGINFERDARELKNVGIPVTKFNPVYDGEEKEEPINSTRKGSLTLDGYDSSKSIAFEFISEGDYSDWRGREGVQSTVSTYEFLSTARALKEGIEGKNGDTTIGIFYNPMEHLSEKELAELRQSGSYELMEARARALSKDNLRAQVKDFLEWLKSQGIV